MLDVAIEDTGLRIPSASIFWSVGIVDAHVPLAPSDCVEQSKTIRTIAVRFAGIWVKEYIHGSSLASRDA